MLGSTKFEFDLDWTENVAPFMGVSPSSCSALPSLPAPVAVQAFHTAGFSTAPSLNDNLAAVVGDEGMFWS